MKKFLLILLLFGFDHLRAQNLVSDPSFEDMVNCPRQIGLSNYLSVWETWRGTPDYYHSCANATHPNFGVPYNNRAFQVPHSGVAYIGLFTFSNFKVNEREFVGSQLLQSLVIGQKYFVSFWIANPDTVYTAHSTDNVGVKFSTVQHSLVLPDTVTNIAHVFTTSVVFDTSNWVFVSGSFIADSAYTFIELGNFFQDSLTTIINPGGTSQYAYYFFDDICVSTDSGICNLKTGFSGVISQEEQITLYPNPAVHELNIEFAEFGLTDIRIFNIFGELNFYMKETNIDKLSIKLEEFNSGIYFLEIIRNNRRTIENFMVGD